jgi:sporulation protein YlmC with PRC-barrel domain
MTQGKYFNRSVMSLDTPHIGYVVRETPDKIVVFGDGKDRWDIPITEIQTVSKNVLIGLKLEDIDTKHKASRDAPLPSGRYVDPWKNNKDVDLASYEGKFPKSLFNKGVRIENEDHVGFVMKETDDKVVVFGDRDYRFDVPKSKIISVGRNVILGMTWEDLFKYKVDKNNPLPTGESIEKLAGEEENILKMLYGDDWNK